MRTLGDIAAFIARRPDLMRLLAAVERQELPDGWIGAGCIRNAVWDALSRIDDPPCAADVDVIYVDPSDPRPERDTAIETMLRQACPDAPWSVKNQARMHVRNADPPYRNAADAIAHWPETATAIAARATGGRVEVIAPHGVADLVGLIVRPTPAFMSKRDVVRHRVTQKNWQARWPGLTLLDMD